MLFMWMLRFKVSIQDIPLKQVVFFYLFQLYKNYSCYFFAFFCRKLLILESKKLCIVFLFSQFQFIKYEEFFLGGGGGTYTGIRTRVGVGGLVVKSQQSEPLYQPCTWNNKIRIIHASVFSQIKTNDAIGSSVFTHTHTSWELVVLYKFTKYKSGAKYLLCPQMPRRRETIVMGIVRPCIHSELVSR